MRLPSRRPTASAARRVRLSAVPLERRDVPATFTVTSAVDGDATLAGTLRWAITQANAVSSWDTITFALGGPSTVALVAPLPTVADSVTIRGPGAASLTISGGGAVRPFTYDATPRPYVSLSDLTVANGVGDAAGGGGVLAVNASVAFRNVAFTNNTAAGNGGAVHVNTAVVASVTVESCTFTGNVAGGRGGAVAYTSTASTSTVTLDDSRFDANTATAGGAVAVVGTASVTVRRSEFATNATTAGGVGGGAVFHGGAGTVSFADSTLRGNTAAGGAGGAVNVTTASISATNTTFAHNAAPTGGAISGATVTLANCTVVRNAATGGGGGIVAATGVFLNATVVALNTAAYSPDIAATAGGFLPVTGNSSFLGVGDSAGVTVTFGGGVRGTTAAPADPGLRPLGNYGGAIQTAVPLPRSPLVNAGFNAAGGTTDARGTGYPRSVGTAVDIGAVEYAAQTVPGAALALTAARVRVGSAAAGQPYTFVVRYTDDATIKAASANGDTAAVTVTGPNGFVAAITSAVASPATDAGAVSVTYSFVPPNGAFGLADVGTYTITLNAAAVQNTAGTSVPATAVGTFQVLPPLTLSVTTTADSGPGSLRAAVAAANATPGDQETIAFALSTPNTITLTSGELTITDGVVVQGPGADLLRLTTVAGRLVNIDAVGAGKTTLAGLTLAGATNAATTTLAAGGAVVLRTDTTTTSLPSDSLTLSAVRIVNNQAATGAAVFAPTGGALTVTDSTLSNNAGGAVVMLGASTVTITRSELRNNVNSASGGAVSLVNGRLTVTDSLLAGNRSTDTSGLTGGGVTAGGGAIAVLTLVGPLTITNSTLANNAAAGNGGAVFVSSSGNLVNVSNSTLVGNSAGVLGGALRTAPTTTITSSILAGNTAPTAKAVYTFFAANVSNSALDATTGFTFGTNSNNLINPPIDLTPLQDNGGPLPSFALYAGSPLIDAGSNPLGLTTDVRGFARVVGAAADIGAVERNGPPPPAAVAGGVANVTNSGATAYTFTVTYRDEGAITAASVADNLAAVRVVGPSGSPLTVTAAAVNAPGDGPVRTVTYTVTPPGGTWDDADAGAYTVSVTGGQVQSAGAAFVADRELATFNVYLPGRYVVTTTADSGPGSLRQAILDANATAEADTIGFSAALFWAAQTISLSAGEMTITAPLTLAGPAGGVTLTTTKANRFLTVNGIGTFAVAVSNVAFVGGSVTSVISGDGGGAVQIADESATFTNCQFVGNKATFVSASGGAIVSSTAAALTITGCTFTGNYATNSGGAVRFRGGTYTPTLGTFIVGDSTFTANSTATNGFGGAVHSGLNVAVTITRATLAGNTAGAGGAIDVSTGSSLTLVDSAAIGNRAVTQGGAIQLNFANGATIVNSTLAQNVAGTEGGALNWPGASPTSPLTVRNSTVAQNEAGTTGGAFAFFNQPSITLSNTAVGGNRSPTGHDFDAGFTGIGNVTIASTTRSAIMAGANLIVTLAPGDLPLGIDLKLSPLLDTSGIRLALVPAPGSPLIDAGTNPLGLATDARGFARSLGGGVDIGAAERIPGPVVSAASTPDVTATATSYQLTVSFADDLTGAIAANSLAGNTAAVTVTGPTGVVPVTAATLDVPTDGSPRTVTYTLTPPGGSWDGSDFGVYTVTLNNGQAKNAAGTAIAGGRLGTFVVRYTQTFTVTNTLDDGSTGSFRWAVAQANAAPLTADTVAFAPGLTGTVALASQVVVTDPLTITGAGAAVTLTGTAGVLNVAAITTLSDFAVRGATATAGAAIVVGSGTSATLTRMLVADNTTTATGAGGAILSAGTLTISDSTFTNNVGSGTATLGGAIAASSTTTITRSVFTGNQAAGGAAVYSTGTTTVDGSLLANNTATAAGGALAVTSTLTVRNSTLANNTAATTGGAISATAGTTTLDGVTVVGNTAAGAQGGGFSLGTAASAAVQNTVIAGNSGTGGPDLYRPTGGTGTLQLINSLIGVGDTGFTATGETATLKGTLASPLDPQLGPLQANGGPTLTRVPLAGSPLIDAGTNPSFAAYDQRGYGYARTVGGLTDIGSVEVQPPPTPDTLPPTLTLTTTELTSRLIPYLPVNVRLADNYAVDPATVQAADFVLTGPGGFTVAGTSVTINTANSPPTATVRFPAPGGTWLADRNGTYTVTLTGSVLDVNGLAAPTGPLGTVAVAVPVGIASVVAVLPDGTTTPLSTAGQRSAIPAIRVLFDGPASGADVAAAYQLVSGTVTVPLSATAVTVNGRTQATLTPAAPLPDGAYKLTAFAASVNTANLLPATVALDGDNNWTAGGNANFWFHRYLADFDGDTAVDGNDLAVIAQAFNSVVGDANYRAWLDLDGDGDGAVDGNDLAVFAQRFNTVL